MKTLFTLFLISIGYYAMAQPVRVSKHITNDGQQLQIRVDIEEPNRSVHYSRSFDVADMEKRAVRELENRIIDSLEQTPFSQSNNRVGMGQKQGSWNRKSESTVSVWRSDEDTSSRLEANATSSLSPADVAPSSVLVREDKENGRLWMQYTFQKDGDELVIERTANVLGKSEREKQAIIKETERSFGIKTGDQ